MATALAMTTDPAAERREAFQEKLMESARGAFNIFTMYLGDRLGYYEALARSGAMTPEELAEETGTHARYAREWMEQQTVAGILEVDDAGAPADKRRFRLPAGHDEVLADTESLNYMAGVPQCVMGAAKPMDAVVDAYRTGAGVSFEAYGRDMRDGISRMNRAMYLQQLGQEWIPLMKDVDQRLRSPEGARVADIGCGCGHSSIGIAQNYPRVTVDAFDLDEASIEEARVNGRQSGVEDRVRFAVCDAAEAGGSGSYDLVMALECIHDLPHPVPTLKTMRALANPDGAVFVVDERVGDSFTTEGEELEWLMYGFSVLHCLPSGMCGCNPAGTGTVMRTDTLRTYAREAGFTEVEVLPIDNPFFRFYRLR